MSETDLLIHSHKKTLPKRFFDASRTLLTLAVIVWGIFINIYLVLHLGCTSCDSTIAPINHIAHYVLLVNFVILIPCLLFWVNWKAVLFLVPGIVFFGLWFGRNWVPMPTPEPEGIEITVSTFNVLGHQADPYDTSAVIGLLNTDIVGLQEVHPFLARKFRRDFAERYPYQVTRTLTDFDEFILLSRFPVVESQFHSERIDPDTGEAMPNHLQAVLDIEGSQVVVYVFHPPNPDFNRITDFDDSVLQAEVEAMVDLVAQEANPVIILCDCNSTPRSRQYRLLDDVLTNAYESVGSGFGLTYPAARPIIRIDHIWYTDEFTALDATVENDSGTSDHRPVWATLDFHP